MRMTALAALAACFAMSQVAIETAAAQQAPAAAHFRAPAAHTFSREDLQQYGLSASDAAQVSRLQAQGYQVQVMTPAEAQRVYGGQWSQGTWIAIGVVALIVIAVAVSN